MALRSNLEADGITWDPYATWDPAKATDEADGLPDRQVVPLVEKLRKGGVVTLQSCIGHEGSSDGHLWIAASTVAPEMVHVIAETWVFERVQKVIHPWRQWEFYWLPGNADRAMEKLVLLTRRPWGR